MTASKFFPGLAFFLLIVTASVAAHAECYNRAEHEAEQGLRLHSELLVIGLTCQRMPAGPAYFQQYQAFTNKNKRLIAEYENELIRHYQRNGYPRPEAQLHNLRTRLANTVSMTATEMRIDRFCNYYGARLSQALNMSQRDIRASAQTIWPGTPTTRPLCELAQR